MPTNYRKVTMQVKKGLQGCKDGETITYWEAGGKTKDGPYLSTKDSITRTGRHRSGFCDQTDDLPFPYLPVEDNEGNVSIPGDLHDRTEYSELTDITRFREC